jgi:hypothetical protein
MEAIPAFVPVARIWVLAIHAYNAHYIGHKLLDRQFWARRVAAVKQLASA